MQNALERRNYVTRSWLLARSAELRERVRHIETDLGGAREPLPSDSTEAAVAVENDEVLQDIRSAALDEIAHIGKALQRLDVSRFAICETCAGEIEPARLEAVEYATQCAHCARGG